MPCSSPKHAPLHLRSQLLRPVRTSGQKKHNSFRECWGSGERLNRPESSNERKRTCSRINSYFDPSVGSDWGSLMSICLAGISLAPGNPTGFLRIGEDSKVVRLELRARHTLSGSKSEEEEEGGRKHLVVLACLYVCTCWMCVKFKGLLVGANSETQTRAGTGMDV